MDAFLEIYKASPYGRGGEGKLLEIFPSPIDEDMIRDHENLLGATLPPLFRAYLLSACLPESDLYVGQLPGIYPDQPFSKIEKYSIEKMEEPFFRRNPRLIPFVPSLANCGDMCFDVYSPDAVGDYPILDFRQSDAETRCFEWSDRDCERCQAFDSFSEYLDYLEQWLIFKILSPGGMFEEWLESRGKRGRMRVFGSVNFQDSERPR